MRQTHNHSSLSLNHSPGFQTPLTSCELSVTFIQHHKSSVIWHKTLSDHRKTDYWSIRGLWDIKRDTQLTKFHFYCALFFIIIAIFSVFRKSYFIPNLLLQCVFCSFFYFFVKSQRLFLLFILHFLLVQCSFLLFILYFFNIAVFIFILHYFYCSVLFLQQPIINAKK